MTKHICYESHTFCFTILPFVALNFYFFKISNKEIVLRVPTHILKLYYYFYHIEIVSFPGHIATIRNIGGGFSLYGWYFKPNLKYIHLWLLGTKEIVLEEYKYMLLFWVEKKHKFFVCEKLFAIAQGI